MIRLTEETRINRKGEEVDASWYLIRYDHRNLALVKGQKQANGYAPGSIFYYSSVETALKGAIDLSIKHGRGALELKEMLKTIDSLRERIAELYTDLPTMIQLLRGTA